VEILMPLIFPSVIIRCENKISLKVLTIEKQVQQIV
jgi:hypothetical protein